MFEIKLTEKDKDILRCIGVDGAEFDLEELGICEAELQDILCKLWFVGLVDIRRRNDKIVEARLSEKGRIFKAYNPTLESEDDAADKWRHQKAVNWITASASVVSLAISLISLFARK